MTGANLNAVVCRAPDIAVGSGATNFER